MRTVTIHMTPETCEFYTMCLRQLFDTGYSTSRETLSCLRKLSRARTKPYSYPLGDIVSVELTEPELHELLLIAPLASRDAVIPLVNPQLPPIKYSGRGETWQEPYLRDMLEEP